MLNYNTALTAEESAYAEAHHGVLCSYLSKNRLPFDEFYDIAVFGYLRAVRKYLARPELWKYSFSTIAYWDMHCDIRHSREYWLRAKRSRETCQLDEERHSDDLRDQVSGAVDNVLDFELLARRITPAQRRIASLRADGYRDKEIAAICRIGRAEVEAEMENARCRILQFRTDDTAQAA